MNFLRNITISFIALLVLACNQPQSNLTDEELAVIVADMHIAENAITRYDKVLRDSLSDLYLEKLEEIHGRSKDEIKFEVELLMENPKRQSEVYSLVLKKLQELEKKIKENNRPKEEALKEESYE